MIKRIDRYRGCLPGLAAGDAVGTSVDFSPPGSFEPVTEMTGGGPFDLEPGQWTDSMRTSNCGHKVPAPSIPKGVERIVTTAAATSRRGCRSSSPA